MSEPTPGLTIDQAAERIMQIDAPIEKDVPRETEAIPAEPSEEVEPTSETTEEVEAVTETADETQEFITDLNEWIKDKSHHETIKIPVKVNGVEKLVPLSEAAANYQIAAAAEERLTSLKAKTAEFEKSKAEREQAISAQLTQATELVNLLEQQFLSDYKNVDWEQLRSVDAAEYSARRQDFAEKQQKLQMVKQGIVQENQRKQMEHYKEVLTHEQKALLDVFPDWADETIAKQEKTKIRDYLLGSGFSPNEIDGSVDANGNIVSAGVIDHRAIQIARKAMLYDQTQQKIDMTKKKVRQVPKVVKPGKPTPVEDAAVEKQKKMRGQLKKSGSLEDAAAIFMDRLYGER